MDKFCWATISVKDLEASIKFYQEVVGLALKRRFPVGSGVEIAFLGDDGTEVELLYDEKKQDISFGDGISLGFQVDSLDEMIALAAQRGISIHSGPFQLSPTIRSFFVLDPDGVKIQFVENSQL